MPPLEGPGARATDARTAPDSTVPPLPPEPPRGSLRERVIARLEARGTHPTWVLWAALAGMFATTFPITILTVSLAPIAQEFGARETTLAWVISAPMLFSAVALPLLGKLGDLHGHRRVFLIGTAAATATAFVTALAWDPLSLIGFRTLAAVLGAATQPTAMALIFGVTPRHERVRAMGWWSMTGAAAPGLGLAIGGPLVDWLGWRIVFVLQGTFSLLALGLAALVLRETPRQRVRFDVAGALLLAVGVGGWMLGLGELRDFGLRSPVVLGAAGVGTLGLAAFLLVERRVAAPIVPLALFRDRAFSVPILSSTLMGGAYMGAFVVMPLLLQSRFRMSVSLTSGILLLRTASLAAASPAGGWLGTRIGERAAALVGCSLLVAALSIQSGGAWLSSFAAVGAGLVLQGVGYGLGLPGLTSAAVSAASEADLGIASAVNRLTGSVGAALGITLLTGIYGGQESGAYAASFAAGAGLAFLSLTAAAAMRR
jgi:MFS family permease